MNKFFIQRFHTKKVSYFDTYYIFSFLFKKDLQCINKSFILGIHANKMNHFDSY